MDLSESVTIQKHVNIAAPLIDVTVLYLSLPLPPSLSLFSRSTTSPPLSGTNEGTISVAEGELLYVIEEDKGDGWTRVRRNEEEEGYVPSSYVEVFLDNNTKGFMTYI